MPKKTALEDRWAALDIACQLFVANKNRRDAVYGYTVNVDRAVLYDVLQSTYIDIDRYKAWHLNDPVKQKSDSIKRVAYFTKWFIRLRPIYVSRPKGYKPGKDDALALLNERFAIQWAFANLGFELGKDFPILTQPVLTDLLYFFHYRQFSDDALIQIYQLIYEVGRGHPIFVNLSSELKS